MFVFLVAEEVLRSFISVNVVISPVKNTLLELKVLQTRYAKSISIKI